MIRTVASAVAGLLLAACGAATPLDRHAPSARATDAPGAPVATRPALEPPTPSVAPPVMITAPSALAGSAANLAPIGFVTNVRWTISYPSGCTRIPLSVPGYSGDGIAMDVVATWNTSGVFNGLLGMLLQVARPPSGAWPGGNYEWQTNWVSPGTVSTGPGPTQTVATAPQSATWHAVLPSRFFIANALGGGDGETLNGGLAYSPNSFGPPDVNQFPGYVFPAMCF